MRIGRVLITGCGGMLGNAVYPYFKSRYSNVLATDKEISDHWLQHLDVRDDVNMSRVFREYSPEIVLHLAAETDLEFCETRPDIAEATNSRGTETVARLCKQHDSTLIYISTAGVFDGTKDGLYTEEDQPRPIMTYGRTKLDGERVTRDICPKSYVIRAGWMMGGGRAKEKKFIFKILKQIEEGRKTIYAVNNLWGTPTYTHDFAVNLFNLIDTRRYGIYHMVCEGSGTRYDVAKELLSICRRADIGLIPVPSDFFREEYFVRRPRSEMMFNGNLRRIGCHHMRRWNIALWEYIGHSFPDFIAQPPASRLIADSDVLGPHFAERRLEARKPMEARVKFTLDGNNKSFPLSARLVDNSLGGLGLLSDRLLNKGHLIRIQTENSGKSVLAAEVRWVAPNGGNFRVGLKYINAALSTTEPLFFVERRKPPQAATEIKGE